MSRSNPLGSDLVGADTIAVPLALGRGGVPVLVKDNFAVAGLPTTAGSYALADAPVAARHAAAVQALLDGGCRVVGRARMHELAFGVTGINPGQGTPINPGWPDRIPGGSSSGSAAAVAAGLVDLSIGTDTGGSIRLPAACCGVVGLKPTFERISRHGVVPERSSLDCVGPFARTVAGIERAMAMLDLDFAIEAEPGTFRLGLVRTEVDAEIRGGFDEAVDLVTVETRNVTLPRFGDAFDAGVAIIDAEMWAGCGHLVDHPRLSPDVRTRLMRGRDVTSDALARAERVRAAFAAEVDRALDDVDVLVLPTLPQVPPLLVNAGDAAALVHLTRLVRPFNLSGHPAVSLPVLSPAGLPVGVQLVGRRGEDAALTAVARAVEARIRSVQPWTTGEERR